MYRENIKGLYLDETDMPVFDNLKIIKMPAGAKGLICRFR